MLLNEFKKVEAYLRQRFNNQEININNKIHSDNSVEFNIGSEFIGIIYRDDEEGSVSYAVHMSVLEEDLTEE